jgi:hypothetical protein
MSPDPYFPISPIIQSANNIRTNGLSAQAVVTNSWDTARRGFFLSPYRNVAENYALSRAGSTGMPALLKIRESAIKLYLQPTKTPGEAYIPFQHFDKIPASAFQLDSP